MVGHLRKNFPSPADVVEALQAQPKGLRAWFSIAFASQKTAQTRYHANGLAQTWRFGRGDGVLANETNQCLPFNLFKIDRAGYVRGLASQFGEMKNPPGHYQINGQTSLMRSAWPSCRVSILQPLLAVR